MCPFGISAEYAVCSMCCAVVLVSTRRAHIINIISRRRDLVYIRRPRLNKWINKLNCWKKHSIARINFKVRRCILFCFGSSRSALEGSVWLAVVDVMSEWCSILIEAWLPRRDIVVITECNEISTIKYNMLSTSRMTLTRSWLMHCMGIDLSGVFSE